MDISPSMLLGKLLELIPKRAKKDKIYQLFHLFSTCSASLLTSIFHAQWDLVEAIVTTQSFENRSYSHQF